VQRYFCNRCGKYFSQPQPLDGLRIEHSKAVFIIKLIPEGMGIRAAARLADCHTHTVLSVLETIGRQCSQLHDQLVRNLTVGALQIDELWAYVGCKRKRAGQNDAERGDFYTFLALTAREKLIVSHRTGKRDYRNTDAFARDLSNRIVGRVQITTDAWQAYPATLRHHLLPRLDYAVMQKNYDAPKPEIEAKRRYSPAPFVGVTVEVKAGNPREDRICTSFVERQNLTVRHFNKRFARLGLGWSRKLDNHQHAVALFVCAHNFVRIHSTLGTTPAVGAGVADKPWTPEELIKRASIY
jgi:IS1 family transposase